MSSFSSPGPVGFQVLVFVLLAGMGSLVEAHPPSAGNHPTGTFGHDDCNDSFTNPDDQYDPSVALYRIPAVVHVIQNTDGEGFLSEVRVRRAMDRLNHDLLAFANTSASASVNTQIEFYLATEDPAGNPTNGITYTTNGEWFVDQGNYYSPLNWDTTRYCNIYTTSRPESVGGGTTPFNSAGLPGDRILMRYSAFGAEPEPGVLSFGRIFTHEVGHYLGLFHVFHDGCGNPEQCYSTGDLLCDTHPQDGPATGCPANSISCNSPDNVPNPMNYAHDICKAGFTVEQARRMRCVLENLRPDVFAVGTSPVSDLSCAATTAALLSWTNADLYDSIEIRRNDEVVAILPGDAMSHLDDNPHPGSNAYRVIAIAGGVPSAAAPCDVVLGDECANAVAVFAGTTFFDTRGASTDGPPEPGLCDAPPVLGEITDGEDTNLPEHMDVRRLSVHPAPGAVRVSIETRGPILSPGHSDIANLGYTLWVDLDEPLVTGHQSYDAEFTWKIEGTAELDYVTNGPGMSPDVEIVGNVISFTASEDVLSDLGLFAFSVIVRDDDLPAAQFDRAGAVQAARPDYVPRDIWFRYEATNTEYTRFSLCGSSYDTKLAVYADRCPNEASALACSDDACDLQSEAVLPVTAGDVFFIRVGSGYQGSAGMGRLTIAPLPNFVRGDANGDGAFEGLADGIRSLQYQFNGQRVPCPEAADADDNGAFNGLVDTIFMLAHQFLSGAPPAAPYPDCGPDPDPAATLGCGPNSCL